MAFIPSTGNGIQNKGSSATSLPTSIAFTSPPIMFSMNKQSNTKDYCHFMQGKRNYLQIDRATPSFIPYEDQFTNFLRKATGASRLTRTMEKLGQVQHSCTNLEGEQWKILQHSTKKIPYKISYHNYLFWFLDWKWLLIRNKRVQQYHMKPRIQQGNGFYTISHFNSSDCPLENDFHS